MATNANWTVVFDDKLIVNQRSKIGYVIDNDSFWDQSKFSNIWALQYQTPVTTDEVEHRDTTPNGTYADANLGDFQQFIDLWDAANLTRLQTEWDNNDVDGETEAEKITRLGARPTSYSS
jgi:hypothetical protein|tara:strand:- start:2857 stop:3216 length:360 start_codon:yes stop_codon:yes gene_type:complete